MMIKGYTIEEIHEAFKKLRDYATEDFQSTVGICWNLGAVNGWSMYDCITIVCDLAKDWPKSVSYLFPVPRPSGCNGWEPWAGEYGKNRRKLLDWLIYRTSSEYKPPRIFTRIFARIRKWFSNHS